MSFIGDLRDGIDRLADFAELECDAVELAIGAGNLSDASVVGALAAVTALARDVQKLEVVLAGVVARRSARDRGHGGLAQTEGFRTPVQMVQEITGATRGEAIRAVKVGEALVAGVPDLTQDAGAAPVSPDGEVAVRPWHELLGDALLAGRLSSAQVDAIRRGLGEPPAMDRPADDVREVWRVAAMQLMDEAASCSVEDLIAAARSVRDAIDPAGAEERWPFLLLPPPGDPTPPIELRTASPLHWMFDPPERRPWRRPSAA